MRVIRFDTIDSTNAEAHRLAKQGERGPLWIVAGRQTEGRGRLGRSWVSEPGNLYCTHLFTVSCDARQASQIGLVASLAVADMTIVLLGNTGGIGLKWPNDVLMSGAKFCGILAEVLARPSKDETVIGLGMGINLSHAPSGMPYPVTSLGPQIPVGDAFAILSSAAGRWLTLWQEGRGFAFVREVWQDRAIGIGKELITDGAKGTFLGLCDDGALLLKTSDGEVKQIYSGEVQFV